MNLDPRRRKAAARRALEMRRDAEQLRLQAEAKDAAARAIEHTWEIEPGWDPDERLDIASEVV